MTPDDLLDTVAGIAHLDDGAEIRRRTATLLATTPGGDEVWRLDRPLSRWTNCGVRREVTRDDLLPFRLVLVTEVRDGAELGWQLGRALDFGSADVDTAVDLLPTLVALDQLADRRRPSTGRPDGCGSQLTAQELRVLTLVSEGRTAASIARLLHISDRTVRKHLEHVYDKLGRHDRLSAVTYARQVGLISTDG